MAKKQTIWAGRSKAPYANILRFFVGARPVLGVYSFASKRGKAYHAMFRDDAGARYFLEGLGLLNLKPGKCRQVKVK